MLPTGTRLGRYEVLTSLGEGGMGEVYRAKDERLGRDVAIKILPSSFSADPDRLRRFEQEARATGALNHPNVIVVHDTGQHDGAPYVVYELLEGTTLRPLLTGTPLSASRTIRLGTDIAAGLAAAHDRGIVHRDLKPENLFVTREGRVKILDFGIASVAECTGLAADTVTKQTTDPGVIVGTVGYMSPEQARAARVDHRSDIFSLGVVLYKCSRGSVHSGALRPSKRSTPSSVRIPPTFRPDPATRCQHSRARSCGIASRFSVSTNGVLAYQAGNTQSRLVWFSRHGSEGTQVGEPGDYGFTALAPDETLVATDVMDRRAGTTNIQVFDLVRGGKPSSVTLDPTIDLTPVFSPDRQQLAFASARGGAPQVHAKRLNDSSPAEPIVAPSSAGQFISDWYQGAGGSFIIFQDVSPGTGLDVMQVALSGDRKPMPLVRTAGDDTDGRISPDGRWLAYVSTETGRSQVYVRALTGGRNRWPISTDGGVSPRWRHDGRELFYIATVSTVPFGATVTDGRLMAVEVSGGGNASSPAYRNCSFPSAPHAASTIPLATASVS